MNWYIHATAMIKQADPHVAEVCRNPHCRKEFVVDLRWERPDEADNYKALDNNGNVLNAWQARSVPQKGNQIRVERSREAIRCPFCGYSWASTFIRKPHESFAPIEHAEEVTPEYLEHLHRPMIMQ